MEARFWGVRGSTPVTDTRMRRYGGNTACLEVRTAGGLRLIFDGGTGLGSLARQPADLDPDRPIEIFLSHFHFDHIQGLPFFRPLHDPDRPVRITAPPQPGHELGNLLGRDLSPVYFPVALADLGSRIELRPTIEQDPITLLDCVVDSIRVDHPSTTHAYRIRADGRTIVYAPDNELAGPEAGTRDRLVRFAEGADLLVHDAMYTDDEADGRRGWGHSTFRQAVDLASDAGVRRLAFFHHDPDRTDDELDAIVAAEREHLAGRTALYVFAAREGETVPIR